MITTFEIFYIIIAKVSSIDEGQYGLEIEYAPDMTRIKSVLTRNDTIIRTVLYGDGIDIITEGGRTYSITTIDGGVICVRDLGNDDHAFYQAFTDPQGSITRIIDGSGHIVFDADYDPWGRQTVTSNTIGNIRGYTGHEMLPEFGLINMNGRMYDPVLGRFLSPDDYVQMPESPQGFNRYSYCMNNPMKYVDPSGEFAWFIPVIVGAAIGAYTGASIQSGTFAFWNWKSSAWKGAITGGIIGASLGYSFSCLTGAGGLMTNGIINKIPGTISSIINSGTVNIGVNGVLSGNLSNSWKAGLAGLVTGAWTITGGFGMVNAWNNSKMIARMAGKLGYQMIGTTLQSVGNNWTAGKSLFSRITLGVGPINLTFGRDNDLWHQIGNNWYNLLANAGGLSIVASGGKMEFDMENLTFNYRGGFVDKLFKEGAAGLTLYTVMGNSSLQMVYQHELYHLWHSRSMGFSFILNYGLQGINAWFTKGNFIASGNYYEDFVEQSSWWPVNYY